MRPFHQIPGVASGWFLCWYFFPLSICRHTYSDQLSEGPQLLRPYHLSWRSDFGLSAILEPDEMYTLAELYLTNGFLDSCMLECILNLLSQHLIENSHCLSPATDSAPTPTFRVWSVSPSHDLTRRSSNCHTRRCRLWKVVGLAFEFLKSSLRSLCGNPEAVNWLHFRLLM